MSPWLGRGNGEREGDRRSQPRGLVHGANRQRAARARVRLGALLPLWSRRCSVSQEQVLRDAAPVLAHAPGAAHLRARERARETVRARGERERSRFSTGSRREKKKRWATPSRRRGTHPHAPLLVVLGKRVKYHLEQVVRKVVPRARKLVGDDLLREARKALDYFRLRREVGS